MSHVSSIPTVTADLLSQWPNYDEGKEDNKEVTPLSVTLFDTTLWSTSLCNDITIHQQ